MLASASPRTRLPAKWCNTCNRMREPNWHGDACLCCGQLLDAKPGDPCAVCEGAGVVEGIVVLDRDVTVQCPACNGAGCVPRSTCGCGRQDPSGMCSECAERGAA